LGSGRRWVHFRAVAEALKAEGRLYLARAGFYSRFRGYDDAFPLFAERVGNALQKETEEYVSTVLADLNRRHDEAGGPLCQAVVRHPPTSYY